MGWASEVSRLVRRHWLLLRKDRGQGGTQVAGQGGAELSSSCPRGGDTKLGLLLKASCSPKEGPEEGLSQMWISQDFSLIYEFGVTAAPLWSGRRSHAELPVSGYEDEVLRNVEGRLQRAESAAGSDHLHR